MHATLAPSPAKPAAASPASVAVVQARCACDAAPCTSCGADTEAPVQAALLPGHDFARVRVHAAAPSERIAGRDDPLELEADRTAEQVLRRLASLPAAAAQAAPVPSPAASPAAPAPALQRQVDPDEDAADAAAEAALAGPELEAAPPGGDDDGGADDGGADDDGAENEAEDGAEPLQAAGAAGAAVTPELRAAIGRSRGGGAPLPAALGAAFGSAFGADFGAVRIHADAQAAALAASVQARAFATGRDIYFGAGHYDPASDAGRRLLAHELTHVLQQGAAPAAAPALLRAPLDAIQCDPAPPAPGGRAKRELFGAFYYFDAKGDMLRVIQATQDSDFGIRPGYYKVSLTPLPGSPATYVVDVEKVGQYTVRSTDPKSFEQLRAHTDSIYLLVYDTAAAAAAPDKPGTEPSANDPTGPATPPGTQPAEPKPGEAGAPPPDAGKAAAEAKGGGEKAEGDKEDKEQGGKSASDLGSGADKGGGLPGEKKGSKFGVFGLLNLPQPLVDLLEDTLAVLGDSAEMEAMADSLRMLKDLAEHRGALAELFKDPDTLLEIALGLKENAAIDAIEQWAARDVKPSKKALGVKHKGIARLAAKLAATAAKLRKVLKPVFKVRSAVQSAAGGVGLLLEAMPALESLMSLAADPDKLSALDLDAAVDDFAVDFAAQLKQKLDFAPKALKDGIARFAASDLVSYEELAAAVTAALLAMVPKQYKPIVKAGKALGIDGAVADHVIAPLIPKEAFDGVNDVLRALVSLVEPTLEAGADAMQKIVDDLAAGFLDELPAGLRSVIKPSRHGRGPARRSSARAIAGLIGRSAGAPLDEDARSGAETAMGQLFGDVRVHTDHAAQQASERLGANAFTIGNDVYFGPGRFDPASSGGRRLLYHELAHTVQQQGGMALQPDYKALLARLAKRFSATIIAELRGASTRSPAMQKDIQRITTRVSNLIGQKVVDRQNPRLPTGYSYIPKDKGKIKVIRRSLKFIRFVPALTIDKQRRIRLALTLMRFDPKAPMRRALRASLGCTAAQEAHHLIPLELYFNPAVAVAKKNGFRFNGPDNGLCVSDKIHAGSHPKYTESVRVRLGALTAKFGTDWSRLKTPFEGLVADLRSDVKKRRSKLS